MSMSHFFKIFKIYNVIYFVNPLEKTVYYKPYTVYDKTVFPGQLHHFSL